MEYWNMHMENNIRSIRTIMLPIIHIDIWKRKVVKVLKRIILNIWMLHE